MHPLSSSALLTFVFIVAPAASRRLSETGTARLAHGSPDCPCINPYPLTGPGTNISTCSGILHAGTCYPPEYGAGGCRAYDAGAATACQADSPPKWCMDRWCYVGTWNCLRPRSRSSFIHVSHDRPPDSATPFGLRTIDPAHLAEAASANGGTMREGDDLLTYSYETCGNVDDFTYQNGFDQYIAELAARGPLRISIPGDEPPYIVTLPANDTTFVQGTAQRDGSIVRFVTDLLDRSGLQWVEVPITPESRSFSPDSSFTACVHDVALNSTDICVGSFWAYEYRRRLASFSSGIEMTNMHVITKKNPTTESFSEMLARPFKPFGLSLWIGFICALVYAGYGIYTLDATGFVPAEESDVPLDISALDESQTRDIDPAFITVEDDGNAGSRKLVHGTSAHAKTQIKYAEDWKHTFCPTTSDDMKSLLLSMAQSVQAFIGGSDFRQDPRTPQAWVVFWGMSFLILVSAANYTAQVTSNNIIEARSSTITSLEEGIERDYTFCGWSSLEAPILATYPRLAGRYKGFSDGKATFQGMDQIIQGRPVCDAAIIDDVAWQVALGGAFSLPEDDEKYRSHSGGAARYHCDTKMLLPTVVFSVDIALPVRSDLQRLLSWLLTKDKDSGIWRKAHDLARQKFIAPSKCSDEGGADSSEPSLKFEVGAGVIFISIATTTIGLILNGFIRATPAERRARARWTKQANAYLAAAKALGVETQEERSTVRGRRCSVAHIAKGRLAVLAGGRRNDTMRAKEEQQQQEDRGEWRCG